MIAFLGTVVAALALSAGAVYGAAGIQLRRLDVFALGVPHAVAGWLVLFDAWGFR